MHNFHSGQPLAGKSRRSALSREAPSPGKPSAMSVRLMLRLVGLSFDLR